MRRALGLAAGLTLVATALSPASSADAGCLSARKCEREALIAFDLTVRGASRAAPGREVTYVLDYSTTWTPSFAPYWGYQWVGGSFPKGARGPSRATLFDTAGRRLATFPCGRYADGVWCEARGGLPRQGRVVLSARLPAGARGAAAATLGFDSFDGLNERDHARRHSRAQARAKFCNYRFSRTVTTKVS
ncbi:hypothetical protein ACFYSC_14090 [Streptosporangium sp. NPDC004379]|uniref:hypothetical protein n=1 Tax=Streptosporangium sp. NPDC004379 TaxID=3366189 RepID=UPI0036B77872